MNAPVTVARNTSVDFSAVTIRGDVVYLGAQDSLVIVDKSTGVPEALSTNLSAYGITPRPGHVFIKDWSECSGLTESLADSGLVEIVETHSVGPFESKAYEVKVLV